MRHGHSPAPKPRNVLYMDGKGDPSVYAKTLAGLSERQSAGNLRVINLMTGPEVKEQRERGRKVSHSLDLFEGFDESMLGRWLVDMAPEVSLARLDEPKDTQSYVLVLAPAMEKAPKTVAMLTRAIVTSFRLGLEKRAPMEHCDTLAVFDEFEYCLEPADIKALVRLQNRGCGVVWASDSPNDVQKAWRRDEVDLFEWAGVETGTHVMMHQCYSHQDGGVHLDAPYIRHQQRHWPAGSFPDQPIEEVFQALQAGQAFVWSGSSLWRTNMGYANVPTLRSYFLTHAQHLPPTDYAFSSTRLVTVNEERQTQVLQQRFSEWSERGETPAPTLSWCQETVARMLGFANWQEAHQALGHQAPT